MNHAKPSLRQKILLNVYRKYIDAQIKLHDLSYLFWECTTRCNIKCLHCGSDCRTDQTLADMPAQDFLKVTDSVRKQYNPNKVMIVITGGEPLVRKDLESIGAELYKQGYPWGMVTNGFALTPQRFKNLLASGLRSVTVSLDGFRENHDWLRGVKGSWEKAMDAVKLIVKEKDIAYDIVTCVNQKNIADLDKLYQFLLEEKVRYWRLFTIDPIGRAKDLPELFLNKEQFKYLMEFMSAIRKEKKIRLNYGCEAFLGKYEGRVRDDLFFCRAGINIASVLADGSVSVCPNNSRDMVQGNIYQDDFLELWNTKFEVMRHREWTKKGICAECDVHKWCRGNGLHLRDLTCEDPYICHFRMLND